MTEPKNLQPDKGAELATPQPQVAETKTLAGIKGWLLLPLLSLFVIPVRTLFFVMNDLLPAFSDDVWLALTTPGSEAYHHLWGPVLIAELSGNLTAIAFSILLLVLFFKKSRLLPNYYVAFLGFNLLFVVGDYYISNLIPFVAAQDDHESVREMTRSISAAAVWVPYFLVSKRVKATFVH